MWKVYLLVFLLSVISGGLIGFVHVAVAQPPAPPSPPDPPGVSTQITIATTLLQPDLEVPPPGDLASPCAAGRWAKNAGVTRLYICLAEGPVGTYHWRAIALLVE